MARSKLVVCELGETGKELARKPMAFCLSVLSLECSRDAPMQPCGKGWLGWNFTTMRLSDGLRRILTAGAPHSIEAEYGLDDSMQSAQISQCSVTAEFMYEEMMYSNHSARPANQYNGRKN